MTGLWLGETAYRNGSEALAQLIVDTAQAAAKVALDRQTYLIKEFNDRLTCAAASTAHPYDGSTFQPRPPRDE